MTTASTISYANAYSTVVNTGAMDTLGAELSRTDAVEPATFAPTFSPLTAIKATLAWIGSPVRRALSSAFMTSLADERSALVRLANAIADTDPGLASDLRAAAARDW
jgi:hypothetical protein